MKTSQCSLCGSYGVTRTTCPLNPNAKSKNSSKHSLVRTNQTGGARPFHDNIERLTVENKNYREVLYTTPHMQLVLMALRPLEEIGLEVHPDTTQFFRFESGKGIAIINGVEYTIKPGDALVVPPKTTHNIINTSATKLLKLYTIYSPPHHPPHTLEPTKE